MKFFHIHRIKMLKDKKLLLPKFWEYFSNRWVSCSLLWIQHWTVKIAYLMFFSLSHMQTHICVHVHKHNHTCTHTHTHTHTHTTLWEICRNSRNGCIWFACGCVDVCVYLIKHRLGENVNKMWNSWTTHTLLWEWK